MKTCPDCGERVYSLGCVNCEEKAYIDQQAVFDAIAKAEAAAGLESDRAARAVSALGVADDSTEATWAGYPLTWGDEG